jgi:7-cyano-7-deazaguanine synthase
MSKESAVSLLSGGIDSSVVLALAVRECKEVLALTFDYGQKARLREISAAGSVAVFFGVPHMVVQLDFSRWGGSALTDADMDVPMKEVAGIPVTYVPGRNIVFISVAASIAQAKGFSKIYCGANSVDYSGYPDCRPEFIEQMQAVLRIGMGFDISVEAPLIRVTKKGIIEKAKELGVPVQATWSCYLGGKEPCGKCPSCRIRLAAERHQQI